MRLLKEKQQVSRSALLRRGEVEARKGHCSLTRKEVDKKQRPEGLLAREALPGSARLEQNTSALLLLRVTVLSFCPGLVTGADHTIHLVIVAVPAPLRPGSRL